ncbi:MAG: hypothetical protein ACFCU3_03915 [Verrucomicrobiales bacterium]
MAIFTFHGAKSGFGNTLKSLYFPPTKKRSPGLLHAECMTRMTLGAPIFSTERMQLSQLVMFAAWENHEAIDRYLESTQLGQIFSKGWHVRMTFLRRWGHVDQFAWLPESVGELNLDAPVVAVTLARMRLTEVPRFIRWGRPVEEQVRDDPGTSLAIASMRMPRTVSTFTVWRSAKQMLSMVHGHSSVSRSHRHAAAMTERERKDFHFQFTTLRFKPLQEYGNWNGRTNIVPG